MKEQIDLLIELQDIYIAIDALTAKRVDLPQALQRIGEELELLEKELQEDSERVEALKSDHRDKETALKNNAEQVKKAKGRLLEVKTNKEYEATLKEIDVIQAKNEEIEDEIIRLFDAIDSAGEILKIRQDAANERRAGCEKEMRKMKEELESIDSELAKVQQKRDAVRSRTNAGVLKKFDMIKNRKSGKAIVPVWKAVCYGCHMNIPPQMYNELQRNDHLVLCPHCERIIYWENRGTDA